MLKQFFTGLLLMFFVGVAAANTHDEIQLRLQKIDPRIEVTKVTDAPLKDFYLVQLSSGDLLYVSKQQDYIFAGSLLEITTSGLVDLTENARSAIRTEVIQAVTVKDQVVYAAKGETKAIVQVFTDSTCPYCSRCASFYRFNLPLLLTSA